MYFVAPTQGWPVLFYHLPTCNEDCTNSFVQTPGHVAAPVAAATRWTPTAVTTILELWDRQVHRIPKA